MAELLRLNKFILSRGDFIMYRILVCDDEKEIVEVIRIYLEEAGYEVICCFDGEEALRKLKQETIHLIILDIMMPKIDGLTLARKIRRTNPVPILFLSAKTQDTDKIIGLNAGADDYICKPFQPLELTARVKSNLRRYISLGGFNQPELLKTGGLTIDNAKKEVRVDGELIRMTPTEYNLLFFLTSNKGRVFSIPQIYEQVWNEPFDGAEKKVVVHISHIRDKIEINPKNPRYLKIVWGLGYKIESLE